MERMGRIEEEMARSKKGGKRLGDHKNYYIEWYTYG